MLLYLHLQQQCCTNCIYACSLILGKKTTNITCKLYSTTDDFTMQKIIEHSWIRFPFKLEISNSSLAMITFMAIQFYMYIFLNCRILLANAQIITAVWMKGVLFLKQKLNRSANYQVVISSISTTIYTYIVTWIVFEENVSFFTNLFLQITTDTETMINGNVLCTVFTKNELTKDIFFFIYHKYKVLS